MSDSVNKIQILHQTIPPLFQSMPLLFYDFSFAIIYSDLLRPNGFLRTHQSHLVNPKYVKSWLKEDGGILLLTSGEKIPVSKPNKETVKQALQRL